MKVGIISPANPHKGLHRDAEIIAWALTESGINEIEIFHLNDLQIKTLLEESEESDDPTSWSIPKGKVIGEWLNSIEVLFLLEKINLFLISGVPARSKIVYIPNLEWAIVDGNNQDTEDWILGVRHSVENGMVVLAKTPMIGEVLRQHEIDCTVVNWSIPDPIRKSSRPSSRNILNIFSRRKKVKVLMNAGLGGWRSRRGVDVMLRAIELMPKKHPYNFILKTIRPWSEYELGDCPSSLELIEGYLPREEMNSLVGTADLIIYPSRFEGFGISLLEALHRAIPVMCTNGWPMNELQTIVDDRLSIRISKKTPLRLAYSFEPSPQSIVDNLIALSGKNLSKIFLTSEVTKGLHERQKQFITQLGEIVQL